MPGDPQGEDWCRGGATPRKPRESQHAYKLADLAHSLREENMLAVRLSETLAALTCDRRTRLSRGQLSCERTNYPGKAFASTRG